MGNEFKEKLDFTLIGRRHNGIRTLRALLGALHSQGGVLAGGEFEFAAGLHPDHPQNGSEVPALVIRPVNLSSAVLIAPPLKFACRKVPEFARPWQVGSVLACLLIQDGRQFLGRATAALLQLSQLILQFVPGFGIFFGDVRAFGSE